MRIAGGIFAVIAGILGCFAAMGTLMFGGSHDVGFAHYANTVIGFGDGDAVFRSGLILSLLTTTFGACVITSTPRRVGYLLIASSIAGAILGGPMVAMCMAPALIGGVLSLFGKRSAAVNSAISQR